MVANRTASRHRESKNGTMHRRGTATVSLASFGQKWLNTLRRRQSREGEGIIRSATRGQTDPLTCERICGKCRGPDDWVQNLIGCSDESWLNELGRPGGGHTRCFVNV